MSKRESRSFSREFKLEAVRRHEAGSKVLRDFLELRHRRATPGAGHFRGFIQAVVDVILDQGLLGSADRSLDRMHLLGDVEAAPLPLDHGDDIPDLPGRPVQEIR